MHFLVGFLCVIYCHVVDDMFVVSRINTFDIRRLLIFTSPLSLNAFHSFGLFSAIQLSDVAEHLKREYFTLSKILRTISINLKRLMPNARQAKSAKKTTDTSIVLVDIDCELFAFSKYENMMIFAIEVNNCFSKYLTFNSSLKSCHRHLSLDPNDERICWM